MVHVIHGIGHRRTTRATTKTVERAMTVAQQARELLLVRIRPNNAWKQHENASHWLGRLRCGSRRRTYRGLRSELRAYRALCVQKSLKWGSACPWGR